MAERRSPSPVVVGECRFDSRIFSNVWRLLHQGQVVARMRRVPSRHLSVVELSDGTEYRLEPRGWGTVVALQDDAERGRITRRSWWGRSWDLTSTGFAYGLVSDPMPRRWTLRVGNEPVGRLAGTLWSYNQLRVQVDVAVPVLALVLAWHVLARPWEAAAAPGSLVPAGAAAPAPQRRPQFGADG
jgi:hypothetical protein